MVKKVLPFELSQVTNLRRADGASQTPAFFGIGADGQTLFLKQDPAGTGILEAEADGLRALCQAQALRTPTVYFHSRHWLVMEAVLREPARESFWKALAEGLVALHRQTGPWGWPRDNFIGRNPQRNHSHARSWAEFFWQQRIVPQLEMLRERAIWTAKEERWLVTLEAHVKRILSAVEEPASLLHGDLWSGNVLCGIDQTPILIDPAVYYGHREADLAMTELFGGFARSFYQRYKELWPLAPGYPERRLIYNFYHKLNHANLYGSGYIWDVKKTLLDICAAGGDQPPMAENV
ncbi:fructosamine kinase family protein [Oligoflexus tunisiensis]|uniref:fructosamine kinase family protein n=1 Tax=Oligoflexus tunisiensis TaxID=708132 RepID=UPI000A553FEE|nr:fructosamine kinase family protein [Oligoflexus tunisiensis]